MSSSLTPHCRRCKGLGHCPTEPGEEGTVKSCPDCEGTGEDFQHELSDDEIDEMERRCGKD